MTSPPRLRAVRRRRIVWIAYWCCLFIVTHIPIPAGVNLGVKHGDKIIHFVVYFVLTWLGGCYLRASERPNLYRSLMRWALVYLAYGCLDECLQPLVRRSFSYGDILANATGIALASLILAWLVSRRGISEPDKIE